MAAGNNVGRLSMLDLAIKSPRLGTYIQNNTAGAVILLNEKAIGQTISLTGKEMINEKKEGEK